MDKKTLKRVLEYAKPELPMILLLSLLGVIVSVFGVYFALLSKHVVDAAVAKTGLVSECIRLGAVMLIQLLIEIAYGILYVRTNGRLLIKIRDRMFEDVLNKEMGEISSYHSAELINLITGDSQIVCGAITDIIPTAVSTVVRVVLSFVLLFRLDKQFAFICILAGPVILLAAGLYRRRMKELHKEIRKQDGVAKSFMQECIRNMPVIKIFCAVHAMSEYSNEQQHELYKLNMKRKYISIGANVCFFIIMTAGYYFALGWGAFRLSKGLISFGTLVAMTELAGEATLPFKTISSLIPQYYSMLASTERIIDVENIAVESGEQQLEINLKSITVKDISFSYGEKEVFKNFGFEIHKGEFVGICGTSGIGKSTLLKLITGLRKPSGGRIYITDKDGSEYEVGSNTRSLFAYVPQDNMILCGSVADNICFSKQEGDARLIQSCAEAAHIWDDIQKLTDGLNTHLGENGAGLSGGQIQRIAIARALYKNAQVLLLDEATSGLDEVTEQKLLESIRKLDITCLIVTHRNTVLNMCDRICYI